MNRRDFLRVAGAGAALASVATLGPFMAAAAKAVGHDPYGERLLVVSNEEGTVLTIIRGGEVWRYNLATPWDWSTSTWDCHTFLSPADTSA